MAQQAGSGLAGLSYTIVPFNDISKLPACAAGCGPLWDANGACVPPVVPQGDPSTYQQCFCSYSKLAPFATGTTGVCDAACDAQGMNSIVGWFSSECNIKAAGNMPQTTSISPTNTASSSKSNNGGSSGGGGDWISNHWQWVIMLVVLVVAIAGIWIGACVWRRRYIRKKDRQSSLPQKHSGSASNPSWGPAIAGSETATTFGPTRDTERGIMAAKTQELQKAKQKIKKWIVSERT